MLDALFILIGVVIGAAAVHLHLGSKLKALVAEIEQKAVDKSNG